MSQDTVEYLPDAYLAFRDRYRPVAEALDSLGEATGAAGPLDERTAALVRLGVAVGSLSEGSVRSNVRKAIAAGASADEVRHVAVLAIPTRGFPSTVAALHWIDEVLSA
jgi:alkylhydroperoxidase/carboxymuconolactone decarboxylase family protein YurZ